MKKWNTIRHFNDFFGDLVYDKYELLLSRSAVSALLEQKYPEVQAALPTTTTNMRMSSTAVLVVMRNSRCHK